MSLNLPRKFPKIVRFLLQQKPRENVIQGNGKEPFKDFARVFARRQGMRYHKSSQSRCNDNWIKNDESSP